MGRAPARSPQEEAQPLNDTVYHLFAQLPTAAPLDPTRPDPSPLQPCTPTHPTLQVGHAHLPAVVLKWEGASHPALAIVGQRVDNLSAHRHMRDIPNEAAVRNFAVDQAGPQPYYRPPSNRDAIGTLAATTGS